MQINDVDKMEQNSTYRDKSELLLMVECKRMLEEQTNKGSILTKKVFKDWAIEHGWRSGWDYRLIDYVSYKHSLP